jgi:hypothetical protein
LSGYVPYNLLAQPYVYSALLLCQLYVFQERKRALIEMDNRLLLDRLAIAMQSKNIDNVLVEKPFISLMELQRKKELKKIMISNSRLLDRIQSTVPSYDHVVWEKDAEHHVEILRNMTEFPELFVAPGTHQKGRDMRLVDDERARARAEERAARAADQRTSSASPQKGRPASKGGLKGSTHSGTGSGDQEMGSPGSLPTGRTGYVPYSYFPEEQYAQYQRNLVLQQQQQQQLQMQAMQGTQGMPYGGNGSYYGDASMQVDGAMYGAGSSSGGGGAGNPGGPVPMQLPMMSPEQLQQAQYLFQQQQMQQQQQLYAYHLQEQHLQQRQPFQQQAPPPQQQWPAGFGEQNNGNVNLYYGMQQPQPHNAGQGGVVLPDIYQHGNRGY